MAGDGASKRAWLPLCLSLLGAALWLPQVTPRDHNVSDLRYAFGTRVAKLLFCH